VHATALGVGERVGNVELELLVANLHLLGVPGHRLAAVSDYVAAAARALGVTVPPNQPVVGADAFRTGTGTHAAALLKAAAVGDAWLADRVYAALPAADVGRAQVIELSPVSGRANARHWLAAHGYSARDESLVDALLAVARASTRALADDELHAICRARAGGGA
jgi:2-isopropylmalate synthase